MNIRPMPVAIASMKVAQCRHLRLKETVEHL